MKKISLFALVAFVLASCTNEKLEKRVEDLENRVAQLEQNGSVSTPVSNTVPTANASTQTVDPNAPAPEFDFDSKTYEFGNITEGDVVEHVFKFKNTGESELVIGNVQASCGCTTPKWTKDPVPVGGEGEIHVRFDSKNKVGTQNKSVTITANTNPARTVLYIKGNVAKGDGKSSILK